MSIHEQVHICRIDMYQYFDGRKKKKKEKQKQRKKSIHEQVTICMIDHVSIFRW